jgi:D-glycero-D-manno-heptose 1,7-bisphosphate phosphatase
VSRLAAFLDRDGVLVEALVRDGRAVAPTSLAEFRVVPGARKQVERLKAAGLLCCVVTNQPEVARGVIDRATLQAMHALLRSELPLDDILICTHDLADRCACRKPLPGLLRHAAATWTIDLTASVIVGDRWSDVAAGRAAGCSTVLLDRPYSSWSSSDSTERARSECIGANVRVSDLADAVDAAISLIGSGGQGD